MSGFECGEAKKSVKHRESIEKTKTLTTLPLVLDPRHSIFHSILGTHLIASGLGKGQVRRGGLALRPIHALCRGVAVRRNHLLDTFIERMVSPNS